MLIKLGANDYKVEFDFNAICEIEDLTAMSVYGLAINQNRLGLGAIRAILKAGLSRHHPEISLLEVGDMIQAHVKSGKSLQTLTTRIVDCMKDSGLLKDGATPKETTEKKRAGGKR